MIRKLLATTALATMVASGAYAQNATTPAPASPPAAESAAPAAPVVRSDGSLVSNVIGEDVYNGSGDDAENIGEVSDIVFDKDGKAQSLIIGVGGFLGVGSKNVAMEFSKLKWTEKNGDRWLVADTSKDALTALPAFDDRPYEPAPAPAADGGTAMAPSASGTTPAAPAAPATDTAQKAPADTKAAPADATPVQPADGALASNIMGEDVYNGTGDDAENIGDVKDIVLSKDGAAESLVIGVGGFLGLGTKNVAFDYGKAEWAEKDGDRWLVVSATKEELQGLPDFDRKAYDPAPAAAAAGEPTAPSATAPATATNEATPPAASDGAAAPAPMAAAPAEPKADADSADKTETAAIDRSTLTEMPADKISADTLIGTNVYGADDADIGEISDIVLSADNKVDAVIMDVGGFLGIGSKSVAVGMDNLKFMSDKDGNNYLYTNLTKEQLDKQVAYDKGSYAEKRDEQRLIVQ
ncbi:PRC-barrel domain-containing protein [Mesorhizobium sp. BE184]|uniref:PRC-barrel domain-containing protein n=1 Tax=Mesorhizobium sp. BE184 TaxID=2817714 RepID=UPI0028622142|nr:PRC-barrel domain-containing protein [Mesorhizobium sp. BE184]MDR7034091.1 sporulation protein YlmC with PRC-barrel domain [Mesorhizobium sp. BE184]